MTFGTSSIIPVSLRAPPIPPEPAPAPLPPLARPASAFTPHPPPPRPAAPSLLSSPPQATTKAKHPTSIRIGRISAESSSDLSVRGRPTRLSASLQRSRVPRHVLGNDDLP